MIPAAPSQLLPYDLAPQSPRPDETDTVDIRAVGRFLRRSARLCVIWLLAALCLGVAFIRLSPGYYTARVVMFLEERGSRLVPDAAGMPQPPDPTYADSQIEIIQSDEVIGKVVNEDQFKYGEESAQAADGLTALISRLASVVRPTSSDTLDGVTEKAAARRDFQRFRRDLSVQRLGVSNAVEIDFTSRDPARSAAIANAVAQSYIDNQLDMRRDALDDAAEHLDESLEKLRDKAFSVDPQFSVLENGEQALAKSRELQTRTDTYRALYNSLLQRQYMETSDRLASAAARVITPAEAPSKKSWPRAFVVLAVAAAGGIAGGMGHALLRQATDSTLRTVEDVWRASGVDIIAGIPRIKRRSWRTTRFRQNGLQPAYTNVSAKITETMGKFTVRLQGRQTRRSGFIIGVVAPTASAGTSSIAANLARIVAESGQRTLLVDANWRKPSAENQLLEPNPGRKLATGFAMINLATESLVVLLLRSITPISELNASLSIVATLQQQRAEYDCVVVDFPSIEQTADFEASMATIDEVIVVLEAGNASYEGLGAFLRLVPKNKIAAVVLNKV